MDSTLGFIDKHTQPNLVKGNRLLRFIEAYQYLDGEPEIEVIAAAKRFFNAYKIMKRDPVTEDMSAKDLQELRDVVEFNLRDISHQMEDLAQDLKEIDLKKL